MNIALRSASIVLPAFLSLLAGCDMAARLEESNAHATPIAAEIERAVGKKPDVFSAATGPVAN